MSWFNFGKAIARGITKSVKQGAFVSSKPFASHVSSQAGAVCSSAVARQVSQNVTCHNHLSNIVTEFSRKVCQNFLTRNAPRFPMLAFAAFCLSGNEKEENKASITDLVQHLSSNLGEFWTDEKNIKTFPQQFSEYNIGERLGQQSSNAAVYAADYEGREVALKIMFNYSVPSNETAISEAFEREHKVIPMLGGTQRNVDEIQEKQDNNRDVAMAEHPNIIKLYGKFVDRTPLLHDSIETYPVAVPRTLHAGGYGRNKTLCLVMPKYTCSLRDYLHNNTLSDQQRLSIFHQLLQGVAHLEHNQISHRDLKGDNVLINTHKDGSVHVAITDFGCCLVGHNMLLPYNTTYTDRGGNFALLAPEIASAVPGEGMYLDYSKADAWTCGALSYEIFNQDNPFYTVLQNTDYIDKDVEEIPLCSGFPLVDKLVGRLLQKEPGNRISASDASTIISLLLNAPPEWLFFPHSVSELEVETWLLELSISISRRCKLCEDTESLPPDIISNLVFLSRVTAPYIVTILLLIHEL